VVASVSRSGQGVSACRCSAFARPSFLIGFCRNHQLLNLYGRNYQILFLSTASRRASMEVATVPDMNRFLLQPGLEDLRPLAELALDLRNCWNHSTDPPWSRIEPEIWALTHNPWVVLQTASRTKLEALLEDPEFRDRVSELAQGQRQTLAAPAWFPSKKNEKTNNAVIRAADIPPSHETRRCLRVDCASLWSSLSRCGIFRLKTSIDEKRNACRESGKDKPRPAFGLVPDRPSNY
jgi:hypothetical protein